MNFEGDSRLWRELNANFMLEFHSLLEKETLVDVSLAVEGAVLKAHKLILSACSPYFQNLFQTNPCRHPIVFMKDVNLRMMTHLLNFMYRGKVRLCEDDVPDFMRLAEALQIRGLLTEQVSPNGKNSKNLSTRLSSKRIKKRRSKKKVEEDSDPLGWEDIETESDSDSFPLSTLVPVDGNVSGKSCEKGDSMTSSNFGTQTPAEIDQGGINYEMLETERGRDMLLYEGHLFTQNRMCKDGMRWQCSYPTCKAFCRMSSAGWLTPINTHHTHHKPPHSEIRRRILRMQIKKRAAASGETPGEIIRQTIPEEEAGTHEQRSSLKRCIQRYRKSVVKKSRQGEEDNRRGGGSATDSLRKSAIKSLMPPEPVANAPIVLTAWPHSTAASENAAGQWQQ